MNLNTSITQNPVDVMVSEVSGAIEVESISVIQLASVSKFFDATRAYSGGYFDFGLGKSNKTFAQYEIAFIFKSNLLNMKKFLEI